MKKENPASPIVLILSKIYTDYRLRKILARVSGKPTRPYSHRNFGRTKHYGTCSVLVPETDARAVLEKIRDRLPTGCIAFIGTAHIPGTPEKNLVEIVAARGENQFSIVRIAATNGVNHDIYPDDIIHKLRVWDQSHGINILQADTDSVLFTLNTLPSDVNTLAEDVFKFCPDIVNQHYGDMSALKDAIVGTRSVMLWWD